MSDAKEGPVRDRSERIPLGPDDEIVGAWSLVSFTLTDEAGDVTHAMGEGATGLMLFSPDGYVATQIASRAGEEHRPGGPEVLASAGRWTLDDGKVTYRAAHSVAPDGLSTPGELGAELHGDALTLFAGDVVVGGRSQTMHLVWRRATAVADPDASEP